MIPIDVAIQQERDVPVEGIASTAMLLDLEAASPKVTVVVLDACRDNPHSRRTKSTDKGLARIGEVGEGAGGQDRFDHD